MNPLLDNYSAFNNFIVFRGINVSENIIKEEVKEDKEIFNHVFNIGKKELDKEKKWHNASNFNTLEYRLFDNAEIINKKAKNWIDYKRCKLLSLTTMKNINAFMSVEKDDELTDSLITVLETNDKLTILMFLDLIKKPIKQHIFHFISLINSGRKNNLKEYFESLTCLKCGACCSYYRASFFEGEIISGHASEELISELRFPYVCMKGTENGGRCICLSGTIGQDVKCLIHKKRSTVCEKFHVWDSDNFVNFRCNKARKAHGLPQLKNLK